SHVVRSNADQVLDYPGHPSQHNARAAVLRHPCVPDDDLLSDGRLLRTYEFPSPRRLGFRQGPVTTDRTAAPGRLADRVRSDGYGRDLGRGLPKRRPAARRAALAAGAAEISADPSLVPLCAAGALCSHVAAARPHHMA